MLSVLPDWLDSPITAIAVGNFVKTTHLQLDPAVVQKKGALLLLARVPATDPAYSGSPLVNLTTNLMAPAMVDAILVDGVAIDPTKTGTASARPVLVAQNKAGVMAMAVIDASGLDCVTQSGSITETGAAHTDIVPLNVPYEDPAVRLAIRHLDAPPSDTGALAQCFARVALLMVGRHCDDAGCGAALSRDVAAAVKAAISTYDRTTGSWSVTVQAPSGPTFHIVRGTATIGDVTTLEIDGSAPVFVPLALNGKAIALLP
jgi:hypothetical protein